MDAHAAARAARAHDGLTAADVPRAWAVADPYAALQLPRDASAEEIKEAYKQVALTCHPDRLVRSRRSESEKKALTEKFRSASRAYELIGEESARAAYDGVILSTQRAMRAAAVARRAVEAARLADETPGVTPLVLHAEPRPRRQLFLWLYPFALLVFTAVAALLVSAVVLSLGAGTAVSPDAGPLEAAPSSSSVHASPDLIESLWSDVTPFQDLDSVAVSSVRRTFAAVDFNGTASTASVLPGLPGGVQLLFGFALILAPVAAALWINWLDEIVSTKLDKKYPSRWRPMRRRLARLDVHFALTDPDLEQHEAELLRALRQPAPAVPTKAQARSRGETVIGSCELGLDGTTGAVVMHLDAFASLRCGYTPPKPRQMGRLCRDDGSVAYDLDWSALPDETSELYWLTGEGVRLEWSGADSARTVVVPAPKPGAAERRTFRLLLKVGSSNFSAPCVLLGATPDTLVTLRRPETAPMTPEAQAAARLRNEAHAARAAGEPTRIQAALAALIEARSEGAATHFPDLKRLIALLEETLEQIAVQQAERRAAAAAKKAAEAEAEARAKAAALAEAKSQAKAPPAKAKAKREKKPQPPSAPPPPPPAVVAAPQPAMPAAAAQAELVRRSTPQPPPVAVTPPPPLVQTKPAMLPRSEPRSPETPDALAEVQPSAPVFVAPAAAVAAAPSVLPPLLPAWAMSAAHTPVAAPNPYAAPSAPAAPPPLLPPLPPLSSSEAERLRTALAAQHAVLAAEQAARRATEEGALCVVCLDAPKDTLLLPCKHLCVCAACAAQLANAATGFNCPLGCGPVAQHVSGIFR